MATVTPSVSGAFFQKNRLNVGPEGFEAHLIGRDFTAMRLRCPRTGAISDPCRDHLPFLIVLRRPEFTAGVSGISAGFRRQRMQKQPALHWLIGRNQTGHYLKVLAGLLLAPGGVSGR